MQEFVIASEIQNNVGNLQVENIIIKEIDENDAKLQKLIKQNEKFLKADKTLPKSITNLSIFNELKTYENYKKYVSKDNENIIVNLSDEDFVVWQSDLIKRVYPNKDNGSKYKNYYALEYHKNGDLMGIIKVKPLKINKNNIKFTFYEYRLNNNINENQLKHIQLFNIAIKNNQTEISQFIYRNDKYNENSLENDFRLICYNTNGTVYVAKNEKI